MTLEVSILPAIVAGIAAMIPGSIIYMPQVLGDVWMQEVGLSKKNIQKANPARAMLMTLLISIVTALFVSGVLHAFGAHGVVISIKIALVCAWFAIASSLLNVFFEQRSWRWFKITFLNHVLSYLVIGLVLGLFR